MQTTRERLRGMVFDHPEMDQSELALALGVSRQRIGQLVHDEGDPVNVTAYNNFRATSTQQTAARLVEKIQAVLREGVEVTSWKELTTAAHVSHDAGVILRQREPLFYSVVTQTLAAARDRRRQAKKEAGRGV